MCRFVFLVLIAPASFVEHTFATTLCYRFLVERRQISEFFKHTPSIRRILRITSSFHFVKTADTMGSTGAPGGGDDPLQPPKRPLPADKPEVPDNRIKKKRKGGKPVMKWTEENDNKILLLGLGAHLKPRDYPKIASTFAGTCFNDTHGAAVPSSSFVLMINTSEGPTPKAIQERVQKLRKASEDIWKEIRESLVVLCVQVHELANAIGAGDMQAQEASKMPTAAEIAWAESILRRAGRMPNEQQAGGDKNGEGKEPNEAAVSTPTDRLSDVVEMAEGDEKEGVKGAEEAEGKGNA